MTQYQPKDIPGCVIEEIEPWIYGGLKVGALRNHVLNADVIRFGPERDPDTDYPVMWVRDLTGTRHLVQRGWYVFDMSGGRVGVLTPEEFASLYEEVPA